LVVIAIIALLIGILLPALGPAMNAGRQARCLGNLRGIGQGIELYKNDFRELFPVAKYMPDPWLTSSNEPSLNEALGAGDYIEPLSLVYQCPGDKVIFDTEYVDDDGVTRKCGSSYRYQSGIGGQRLEETWFFTRLEFPPSEIPVVNDYDGGAFETQDGRFVTVGFFHDKRMFFYADGSAGGSKAN
ncbi:MAG: hypothetical protein KDB18_12070, partial [Salinibacterium sp.]|nr:hypothetical protein [Salinibacterium sp.]